MGDDPARAPEAPFRFSPMTPVALTDSQIADNVARVRERIAVSSQRAGRAPDSVRLIAVTKTIATEQVFAAFRAGVTDLGENYVQEAMAKIPAVEAELGQPPTWHFIGHLQSNKAKYSVQLFSLIHSVDNYHLAQEIGKQASKRGKTQAVLVEVNLAADSGRAGVPAEAVLDMAARVAAVPGVELQGLMGMAPITGAAEGARPFFRQLRQIWEQIPVANRRILSMGMSGDFEVAVEEGATHVRIGTALFGQRRTG
jgi:pyridoxal phosphate enzyme (YggS family)